MTGLRTSVFISVVSFLLGLLFTHWIADSLTLWKTPETQTDLRLWTSATYYSIISRMPIGLPYTYIAVIFLGATTLLWSLGDGRAGNLMFDGASALLYSTAVMMYIYSVLPNLFTNFSTLPLPFSQPLSSSPSLPTDPTTLPPFPPILRQPTLELASSHLVCSVALTGVLALQAGRWWAEQKDIEEDDDDEGVPDATEESKPSSPAKNENKEVVEKVQKRNAAKS